MCTMDQDDPQAKWLALSVLGLTIYGYWQPYAPALRWAVIAALVLAASTLVRTALNRTKLLAEPLNMKKTARIATHVVFPILVVIFGVPSLFGYGADIAIFVSVGFALALLM